MCPTPNTPHSPTYTLVRRMCVVNFCICGFCINVIPCVCKSMHSEGSRHLTGSIHTSVITVINFARSSTVRLTTLSWFQNCKNTWKNEII